jgi:hypothetical protein
VRVILTCSYIFISIFILIFTLTVSLYAEWYSYILAGGGGPCINSIVLILELMVLRSELIKERPYTRCHVQFIIFLAIVSIGRFVAGMVTMDDKPECIANQTLSGVLMAISIVQMAYWLVKRQSLPKYISPKLVAFDIFKEHEMQFQEFKNDRNIAKNISDDFPYLIPFVSIENGQLRIVLQIYIKSVKSEPEESSSRYQSFYQTSLLRPSG